MPVIHNKTSRFLYIVFSHSAQKITARFPRLLKKHKKWRATPGGKDSSPVIFCTLVLL
jgi:hypothetical protein